LAHLSESGEEQAGPPEVGRTGPALAAIAQRDALGRVLAGKLARLADVEQRLQDATARLDAWYGSRGYLLAQALSDAARSWRGALALPRRLLQVAMERRAPLVMPAPELAFPALRVFSARRNIAHPLRLLAIVDEFTEQALYGECRLLLPGPRFSEEELDAAAPELLLVESAWRGNQGAWKGRLDGDSADFQRLLRYARERDIATVFWSKEDPIHFDHFLGLARHFDHVLTTAMECVPRYREALKSDRVGVLPFACQPALHNPLERRSREPAFVFAGSYYPQYPKRNAALAAIVAGVAPLGRVDIYDRNLGSGDPELVFPPPLDAHVVGTLPPAEIGEACKAYRFAVNVNTVTDSRTMLARRVFELLASGTLVVGNPSRAVSRLCGEIVVSTDPQGAWRERVALMMRDERAARRAALAGVRKMMAEHTWAHRVARLTAIARPDADVAPDAAAVLCLAPVENAGQALRVIRMVAAQQQVRATLLLVAASPIAGLPEGCRVVSREELARTACATPVAGIWHGDWYGPRYLADLMLAQAYTGGDGVGKAAYWSVRDGIPALLDDGARYQPCEQLGARRALVFARSARCQDLTRLCDLVGTDGLLEGAFHGLDEFNYCAGAEQAPADATDGYETLDAGLSLADFLADDHGGIGHGERAQ